MTIDFARYSLDYWRRLPDNSVKAGKREPMGRRASLVASGMDNGDPLYISIRMGRVSTRNARKNKKGVTQKGTLNGIW